jgi:hypothetical protein
VLLGSVSLTLAKEAPCPVMILTPEMVEHGGLRPAGADLQVESDSRAGQRLTRALPSQMLQTCSSSAGIA